jgi:hypothetical protein
MMAANTSAGDCSTVKVVLKLWSVMTVSLYRN